MTSYRLKDPQMSEVYGCDVWLHYDLESPTDNPNEALITDSPEWFVVNLALEAVPLPPDQQMKRDNQRKLL